MDNILQNLKQFVSSLSLPRVQVIDVIQILIIAVLLYFFINWVKKTRAYALIKGIGVVLIFIFLAYMLGMTTILWLAKNVATVAITAVIVVFQPELRRALEQLGQKRFVTSLIPTTGKEDPHLFSDATINALVRASFDMGEAKTGALIVLEHQILLTEYINTGIALDAEISAQLLINIFEHNTPLHDGAVIIRDERIVAATCYLPLSGSTDLSKKLGTRHRAGLGISEVSDSLTIIVSEETGRVSTAAAGALRSGLTSSELREQLYEMQRTKTVEPNKFRLWKGRGRHEEKSDQSSDR